MTNGESGALFPADGDLVMLDQLADVFKTDGRLVQFHAMVLSQCIDQIRGRH